MFNNMMKCFFKSISVTIVVLFFSISAKAQPFNLFGRKTADSYFLVDYAAFNADSLNNKRLELYYQIYNAVLNFEQKNNQYVAEYEIVIKIYNSKDSLVDSYHKTKKVIVPNEKKAKSKYDYRTDQVNVILKPDKYVTTFTLNDPNSKKVVIRKLKLNLKDNHKKKPNLSDIELVQAAMPNSEKPNNFEKGKITLITSVSHTYGNEEKIQLLFYFEIYRGYGSTDSVRVETKLRHESNMVYRDSLTIDLSNNPVRQFRKIIMDDMNPGTYELSVTLKGHRNKKLAVKYKNFELVWSQKSMLKHDYKQILNQLAIIAPKREIDELKNDSTYEQRLRGFNEFWRKRDPTPGTKENEAKQEFYRRIYIANLYFTILYQVGWKSDRGRVYIVYGEPDQVEDYPIALNSRPYQEWYYYHGSQYRKFIFVDENDDGDYRLQYPYNGIY